MADMNYRRTRVVLWLALLSCVLGLTLLLPTTVSAGGSTIWVAPPNGKDDTANIQAALNACVARGPGCTVQLREGRYLSSQLVTYNFQGTFKGMSQDHTTIEALPDLPVSILIPGGEGQCVPNTTTCLWPSLIMFVNGNINVSDLTIKVTAVPATQPWPILGTSVTMLLEALGFRGKYPMNVCIDRIHMEGQTDNYSTDWGFNVMNGAHFTGELPRSSVLHDYYFLSGSFTVRNSYFKSFMAGISQDGFVTSSHITIGGSPSTGNHFENNYVGTDIEASENSVFELSFNESSSVSDYGAAMWVVPWLPDFVPSSPSQYMIHDNKCYTTGQYADGIYLLDDVTNPWIHAAVWNNTVELQDSLSEGIGVYNTKGTATWGNSVTGPDGFDAIGLWSSTLSTVMGNNVSGFTPDPSVGLAQIYLDPSTTHDLVVCAERSDTVLNQGTNNIVVGCQQPMTTPAAATDSVAPAASTARPGLPKGKPWPH